MVKVHGGDDTPHDEREDEDQSQAGDDVSSQVHGRTTTAEAASENEPRLAVPIVTAGDLANTHSD